MHLVVFPVIVAALVLYLILRNRRRSTKEEPASRFERMIKEREFDDLVIGTSKSTPVLVDFFATWCEPCKLFTPLLAEIAKEYDGAFLLAKIDVDKSRRLAKRFEIASMPTVMLFQDGDCVERFSGGKLPHAVKFLLAQHGISEPVRHAS